MDGDCGQGGWTLAMKVDGTTVSTRGIKPHQTELSNNALDLPMLHLKI